MSSNSGPHFDEDGHCYYLINGQPVWGTSSRTNPFSKSGSDRTIARTVSSRFESHRFPSRNRTEPRTPSPSDLNKRFKTGFPPRFEAGRYQGSAPASVANDYYRDVLEVKTNRHGPPLNSEYVRRCNEYHDMDRAAKAAAIDYKAYFNTATKQTNRTRNASPGIYEGDPWETVDWHQGAAVYADRARTCCHQGADGHGDVSAAYLGYHKRKDIKGHELRETMLRDDGIRFDRRYRKHCDSHRNLPPEQ